MQALEGAWYLAAVAYVGELYSLLSALLWALAVIFFRKSGEQVPPVALNVFKGAVALVLFLVTMLVLRTPFSPPESSRADWLTLLASGAIGIGIADSLFFASLNRLGATGSALVDCVYGPFVVLLAWLYLGEPISATVPVALALMAGAIGVGLRQPRSVTDAEERRRLRAGVALGVASMFLMAAGIVIAKPVLDRSGVLWATLLRLVGGEAVLALFLLAPAHRQGALRAFSPGRHYRTLIPSALIGSYLAMIVWIAGIKHTSAIVAGILTQTSTLFVPLLAALFLGERLTRRRGIAVLLGFGGAVLALL